MSAVASLADRIGLWLGLDLSRGGQRTVLEELARVRAQALGRTTEAWANAIAGPDDPELRAVVDGLTVTHSWFFRDPSQLRVVEAALAEASARAGGRPLQVWIPGCASGEDAYSVAILARARGIAAVVTGSDVNVGALARARAGGYRSWSVRDVPADLRHQLVFREPLAEVPADVARTVTFERHNLLSPPLAAPGGWDVVFCRNVIIYFFAEAAARALANVAAALAPGGWLVLGSSELIHVPPPGLELVEVEGRYAFRRTSIEDVPPRSSVVPTIVDTRATSLVERGHERLRAGDAELAIAIYQQVLARSPADATARLYLAVALSMRREWARAAELLRSLPGHEDSWLASFYLGLAYEKLGRAAEARSLFDRASRLARVGADDPGSELEEWKGALVAVARSRAGRERKEHPMGTRAKILVVDDSEIVLEMISLLLEDHGFEVMTLSDPAGLDETLTREEPDLVLLDVGLEGARGDELVGRAAERTDAPIVLLSDRDEAELAELVRRSGASGFIRKTDSGDVLAAEVSRFLEPPDAGRRRAAP